MRYEAVVDQEAGAPVATFGPYATPHQWEHGTPESGAAYAAEQAAYRARYDWLVAHYPEHLDPGAYWSD